MPKNDYLERQRRAFQTHLDIGEKVGLQKAWDVLVLALTDPEVMSTHRLTKERLTAVLKRAGEYMDYYYLAFTEDVEADKRQDELDKQLYEVWGDDLEPFHVRYPYFKETDYTKGKAKWK